MYIQIFYPSGSPGSLENYNLEYFRNLKKLLELLKANNLTLSKYALLARDKSLIIDFIRKTRGDSYLSNENFDRDFPKNMTSPSNIKSISRFINKKQEGK